MHHGFSRHPGVLWVLPLFFLISCSWVREKTAPRLTMKTDVSSRQICAHRLKRANWEERSSFLDLLGTEELANAGVRRVELRGLPEQPDSDRPNCGVFSSALAAAGWDKTGLELDCSFKPSGDSSLSGRDTLTLQAGQEIRLGSKDGEPVMIERIALERVQTLRPGDHYLAMKFSGYTEDGKEIRFISDPARFRVPANLTTLRDQLLVRMQKNPGPLWGGGFDEACTNLDGSS
jgi:hypothetical protein